MPQQSTMVKIISKTYMEEKEVRLCPNRVKETADCGEQWDSLTMMTATAKAASPMR